MAERLLFYCQHSVGLGHLVRSLALAGALAEGYDVVLLSGGPLPDGVAPPPGVEVVTLPPLGMEAGGALVSRDAALDVAEAQQARRDLILRSFERTRPAVLVVELFPFGRRKFRHELVPLLERARAAPWRPLALSSVRDILVGRGAEQAARDAAAAHLANALFDGVLVHSDVRFAAFAESFSAAAALRVPVLHTGFVHAGSPARRGAARHELVVSAGGGRVGEPLLTAALDAQPAIRRHTGLDLRLVAGPFLPDDAWRRLQQRCAGREGVALERHVPDLCGLLATARASLSQAGYNTTLDLLRSGVPALVVPYGEGDEDEQRRRAALLARRGALRVLAPDRLDAPALTDAVTSLLAFEPVPVALDLDGAAASLRAVAELRARRPLAVA